MYRAGVTMIQANLRNREASAKTGILFHSVGFYYHQQTVAARRGNKVKHQAEIRNF